MIEDGSDDKSNGPDKSASIEEGLDQHDSLKYHLLGPSLTKAGQDSVDQRKVLEQTYIQVSV